MRARLGRPVVTGLLVMALLGLAGALWAPTALAPHGSQRWSGEWGFHHTQADGVTPSGVTGLIGFRHRTDAEGLAFLTAIGGAACPEPTDYYSGGYSVPASVPPGGAYTDTGSIGGCTVGNDPAHLRGRYLTNSIPNQATVRGDIDLVLDGQGGSAVWTGTFTGPGTGHWVGVFIRHASGDGADDASIPPYAAPAPPTPPAAPPAPPLDIRDSFNCPNMGPVANSATRRPSQRVPCPEVSARPVRTATAGRDGTATAPAPTVGNPTAAASPPLSADQEEAIAVIVNKKDVQAVGFTLALTKGISKNEIQQYCLDRAVTLLFSQFSDVDVIDATASTISGFAYCMRSLDRALRATGQAPLALMAVEAASCRVTPRLVTIRRVARARLRVRNVAVRAVTGVRARATCTTRADGSVAIRVKSAAGTPLRKVLGPRLRIGFVQGRGATAGPVEVRFR